MGTYYHFSKVGHKFSSVGSCMVDPTNHLEYVVHSRGNNSTNKIEKESFTKLSFWLKTLVLEWLVVVVALLDEVAAALGRKDSAPLKYKVLQPF